MASIPAQILNYVNLVKLIIDLFDDDTPNDFQMIIDEILPALDEIRELAEASVSGIDINVMTQSAADIGTLAMALSTALRAKVK